MTLPWKNKVLADLRRMERELREIIEVVQSEGEEREYPDLFPLIVAELKDKGSMLDYEIIEKFMPDAREGKAGPESTVWVAIESNVRHGKLVAEPPLKERTNKMGDRKETPVLKDRYYGHRISLPKK